MEGEKLYRENDCSFTCKCCGRETTIGFNILQEQSFEKFKDECVEQSTCGKCLVRNRINVMTDYDPVLLETAKNMICVGVI
jgi:hypothetical protein